MIDKSKKNIFITFIESTEADIGYTINQSIRNNNTDSNNGFHH